MGNTASVTAAGNSSAIGTGVSNMASDLKPKGEEAVVKYKPCCVCKDEKAVRDECMLFARSDNPQQTECRSLVEQYRACMKGYGFEV